MIKEEKPLVDTEVLLEKFPGKGGWTYARIPGIPPIKENPFSWRKIKGFVDGFEIKQYHLMPMGNGELFLPIKAAIRNKIKKESGDWIKIILFQDNDPAEVSEEFITCLKDDPQAWKNFQGFPESDQKKYVQWIYSVKTDDIKVERMAKAINQITRGETL